MASDKDTIIKVTNAAVRFNMASERIDSKKRIFCKTDQTGAHVSEFVAQKDINLRSKTREAVVSSEPMVPENQPC